MMKKLLPLLLILALASTAVHANNNKSTYCNGQEFYTNRGTNTPGIYPHLHCGKRWVTYSIYKKKHQEFLDSDGVNLQKAIKACNAASDYAHLKSVITKICQDHGKSCGDCS